jgi:acyl-CoA thioesterase-1
MFRFLHSALLRSLRIACGVLAASTLSAQTVPRVLVIGDAVYREPVAILAKELKGRVEVVRPELPKGAVLHSGSVLEHLDTLLGDGKWDLIHFNVGLGDLIHRAPGLKTMRVMPIGSGGVRNTGPALYESNLQELVRRLKATDAKLVWASTTPIRASATDVFALGSEIEYNAIAAKVMTEAVIPTNDMYSHVKGMIDMSRPAAHGFDPFDFDRKPVHEPIVKAILSSLDLK